MKKISIEEWRSAQKYEKPYHETVSFEQNLAHYENVYKIYFSYVGLDFDLKGKSLIEIGPAKIPALYFCSNYLQSYIIEPLVFEDAESFLSKMNNVSFIREPAELCNFPEVNEAILFNLLQHVIDPKTIIERCKKYAKTIRFFEPINTGYDHAHLHAFNIEFFENEFGKENVKLYKGGSAGPGFHSQDCAYGVYHCNDKS